MSLILGACNEIGASTTGFFARLLQQILSAIATSQANAPKILSFTLDSAAINQGPLTHSYTLGTIGQHAMVLSYEYGAGVSGTSTGTLLPVDFSIAGTAEPNFPLNPPLTAGNATSTSGSLTAVEVFPGDAVTTTLTRTNVLDPGTVVIARIFVIPLP